MNKVLLENPILATSFAMAKDLRPVRISSDGIFYSVQGEGPLIGVPSLFIRLDTCNLKCKWGDTICDAHYTSWTPGDTTIPLNKLCADTVIAMNTHRCRHVVITGGEPTLQEAAVHALANVVRANGGHSTIETNGTRWIKAPLDLICLSPKLKSSTPVGTKFEKVHSRNRWNPKAIENWMQSNVYFFKFVVDTPDDIEEVLQLLAQVDQRLPDPEHVVLMPQGITAEELWRRGRWLAELCKDIGARFTSRLQVDLYGNRPGT